MIEICSVKLANVIMVELVKSKKPVNHYQIPHFHYRPNKKPMLY